MKKTRKSFASYLAVFMGMVMLFGTVPAFPAYAQAQQDLSSIIGLEHLMRGFNIFSGQELRGGTMARYRLLQDNAETALRGYFRVVRDTETRSSFNVARSMFEMSEQRDNNWSVNVSTSVRLGKLFRASASYSYGRQVSEANRESRDSLFMQTRIEYRDTFSSIEFNTVAARNIIQANLRPEFLEDLMWRLDPDDIFALYGTHFIIGYSAGGWVESTQMITNNHREIDRYTRTSHAGQMSASGGLGPVRASVSVSVENVRENHFSEEAGYQNASLSSRVVGGNFHMACASIMLGSRENPEFDNTRFDSWGASFTQTRDRNAQILTDRDLTLRRLKFCGT